MNLSLFIAKRIAKNKQATFSKFILRLATIATALSVAVMVVAIAVVLGFKTKIREKMFVFWGHAQVSLFNPNPSSIVGDAPLEFDLNLVKQIQSKPEVKNVYPYIIKSGIVKASNGLEGLKLKGVTQNYPLDNSDAIGFDGEKINFSDSTFSNDIILSKSTLDRLQLKIGEDVLVVFFNEDQSNPSVRKLKIKGSFHTGMEEVDKGFALCDIRLLRQVNKWENNDISALQVVLKDYQKSKKISDEIYQEFLQPPMTIATIKDIYPFIFSWLDFQNTNAALILIIMGVVAAINMATALLIYILERTQMVGTLKALGMKNSNIQKVFLFHAARVAILGIFWGNLIGLLLCWLQDKFQLLKLDESIYYMKAAPVAIDWFYILLIDLGTLLFCLLILTLPALIVRRIKIVNALKFR